MRRAVVLFAVVAVLGAFAAPASAATVTPNTNGAEFFAADYSQGPVDAAGNWLPGIHLYGRAVFARYTWYEKGGAVLTYTQVAVDSNRTTIDADGTMHADYEIHGVTNVVPSWTFDRDLSGASMAMSFPASGYRCDAGVCTPWAATYTVDVTFTGVGKVETDASAFRFGVPGEYNFVLTEKYRTRAASVTGSFLLDEAALPELTGAQLGTRSEASRSISR